nr:proline-rich protein 2-like [Manis javanica]
MRLVTHRELEVWPPLAIPILSTAGRRARAPPGGAPAGGRESSTGRRVRTPAHPDPPAGARAPVILWRSEEKQQEPGAPFRRVQHALRRGSSELRASGPAAAARRRISTDLIATPQPLAPVGAGGGAAAGRAPPAPPPEAGPSATLPLQRPKSPGTPAAGRGPPPAGPPPHLGPRAPSSRTQRPAPDPAPLPRPRPRRAGPGKPRLRPRGARNRERKSGGAAAAATSFPFRAGGARERRREAGAPSPGGRARSPPPGSVPPARPRLRGARSSPQPGPLPAPRAGAEPHPAREAPPPAARPAQRPGAAPAPLPGPPVVTCAPSSRPREPRPGSGSATRAWRANFGHLWSAFPTTIWENISLERDGDLAIYFLKSSILGGNSCKVASFGLQGVVSRMPGNLQPEQRSSGTEMSTGFPHLRAWYAQQDDGSIWGLPGPHFHVWQAWASSPVWWPQGRTFRST